MTASLRLAFVTAFPPGQRTLNDYGLHMVRAFAERDDVAEIVVLADRLETPLAEVDLGPKVRVSRVWGFNSPRVPVQILRALRRERPDAVIYNLQTASFGDREVPAALGLLTPALSRLMGWKSGIIAHNIIAGMDLETTILKGQRLRQAVVRTAGAIVTRAMAMANYMTVTLGSYLDILRQSVPRADISLVPHGTFETGRPWIGHENRPMRIVTMGKFGTYKKLGTLLAAFDILREDPDMAGVELVIGGTDHPNTPGYVAGCAADRAGDPGVVFHGYVAEEGVAEFFETARLAVFDYEATTGSSGVMHQAASHGTVPVFPRIGDFVDLVEDEGLTGANFAPGNAAEMAAAMAEMLRNTTKAETIARQNQLAVDSLPISEVAAWHIAKLTGRGSKLVSSH
jgi:hypothetical protein